MNKNKLNKNKLIITSILMTALAGATALTLEHELKNDENNSANLISNVNEELSKDERLSEINPTVKRSFAGGESSGLIIEFSGSEHLFMWGQNGKGQLGLPLSSPSLSAPEEMNVDGGDYGIQGTIEDVIFGTATNYVIIKSSVDNSVHFYGAGDNLIGELGNGTKDPSIGWNEITFYEEDGVTPIVISEYSAFSSNQESQIAAFKDADGKERVFTWGRNNNGQLGQGWYSTGTYNKAKNLFSLTPTEITNRIQVPVMNGNDLVENPDINDDNLFFTGSKWLDSDKNPKELGDDANAVPSKDNGTLADGGFDHKFETVFLNESDDWVVESISTGKQTILMLRNVNNDQVIFSSSGLLNKGSAGISATKIFNGDSRDVLASQTEGGKPRKQKTPNFFIFAYPNMEFSDYAGEDVYSTNNPLFDKKVSLKNTVTANFSTAFSLEDEDGFTHFLYTGHVNQNSSDFVNDKTGQKIAKVNPTETDVIYEIDMSGKFDGTNPKTLPLGSKSIQTKMLFGSTEAKANVGSSYLFLIETPDSTDSNNKIYSIMLQGQNHNFTGTGAEMAPVMIQTTANDWGQVDWYEGKQSDDALIQNWLVNAISDGHTDMSSIYDDKKFYTIDSIESGSDHMGSVINIYENQSSTTPISTKSYFRGSNEKEQITSAGMTSTGKGIFKKPISLKYSTTPLSNSFLADPATITTSSIDISLDVLSGGGTNGDASFESFDPSASNSIGFFGENQIPTSGGTLIPDQNFLEMDNISSGGGITITYIGVGETTNPGAEEGKAEYSMDPVDPVDNIETYHWRIDNLKSGMEINDLSISLNGKHAVNVDGSVRTNLPPSYNPETFEIEEVGSNFVRVSFETLWDVPGYKMFEELPSKEYLNNGNINLYDGDIDHPLFADGVSKDGQTKVEVLDLTLDPSLEDQVISPGQKFPKGHKTDVLIYDLPVKPSNEPYNFRFNIKTSDTSNAERFNIDSPVIDKEVRLIEPLKLYSDKTTVSAIVGVPTELEVSFDIATGEQYEDIDLNSIKLFNKDSSIATTKGAWEGTLSADGTFTTYKNIITGLDGNKEYSGFYIEATSEVSSPSDDFVDQTSIKTSGSDSVKTPANSLIVGVPEDFEIKSTAAQSNEGKYDLSFNISIETTNITYGFDSTDTKIDVLDTDGNKIQENIAFPTDLGSGNYSFELTDLPVGKEMKVEIFDTVDNVIKGEFGFNSFEFSNLTTKLDESTIDNTWTPGSTEIGKYDTTFVANITSGAEKFDFEPSTTKYEVTDINGDVISGATVNAAPKTKSFTNDQSISQDYEFTVTGISEGTTATTIHIQNIDGTDKGLIELPGFEFDNWEKPQYKGGEVIEQNGDIQQNGVTMQMTFQIKPGANSRRKDKLDLEADAASLKLEYTGIQNGADSQMEATYVKGSQDLAESTYTFEFKNYNPQSKEELNFTLNGYDTTPNQSIPSIKSNKENPFARIELTDIEFKEIINEEDGTITTPLTFKAKEYTDSFWINDLANIRLAYRKTDPNADSSVENTNEWMYSEVTGDKVTAKDSKGNLPHDLTATWNLSTELKGLEYSTNYELYLVNIDGADLDVDGNPTSFDDTLNISGIDVGDGNFDSTELPSIELPRNGSFPWLIVIIISVVVIAAIVLVVAIS